MAIMPLFLYKNENINIEYDIDLTEMLIELLDKNTPIKKDSEYVNDYLGKDEATEDNIKNYKKVPVFTDIENDMYDFCESICKEIEKIPGVESARAKKSQSLGMSTYITVNFTQPSKTDKDVIDASKKDPKFLGHYLSGFKSGGGYAGEYRLKFRLSNHDVKRATDADVILDVTGQTYEDFKNEVLNLCKKRVQQLDNYFDNFKKTGKISPKQIKRNEERKTRRDAYNEILNVIYNNLSVTLKESFGGTRLKSMVELEAENVLQYLDMSNIKLEDIVNAVEVEFSDEPIIYAKLLAICAECLVENVIEYTFDGGFDYELLFDDMRSKM